MTAQVEKGRDALESFLSGKRAQVDVRAIEGELKRLWQEAASSKGGDDHPQVIRACSCNLVLFTDRPDAETTDAEALDRVVLRNPSRAILVMSRESEAKRLEAWVTARCHMVPGTVTKQICSEQITVLSQGACDQELISVVQSLVLGDLPVYLWWTLDRIDGERLAPFLCVADRVILDSARAPYSFRFLRNLFGLVESTKGCIATGDLNWRRLTGIRYAIAEEFERLPLKLEDLTRIRSVVVSSAGQELQEDDCSLQALFLVGWLAGRLGWEPAGLQRDEKNRSMATFTSGEASISVRFRSSPFENVGPGTVFDVMIELDDGRSLVISRDPSGQLSGLLVTVKENGKVVRELTGDDVSFEEDVLVCRELEEVSADEVFALSIEKAYELIQLIAEKK